MKPFLCFAASLLLNLTLYGQAEYLVKLDLQTGKTVNVKAIPNVKYVAAGRTTYNETNSNYIFWGNATTSNNAQLYTIDSLGNTLSNPSFQSLVNDLLYYTVDNRIYGLLWDAAAKKEYFGNVDPLTGTFNKLSEVAVKYLLVEAAAIDPANRKYYFIGIDSMKATRLYTISLNNYTTLSSPVFTDQVYQLLHFDAALGKLYSYEKGGSQVTLITIDPATGQTQPVSTIPGIKGMALSRWGYDPVHHYSIFNGLTADSSKLYTVDVTTGNVVYQPPYPGKDTGDNLLFPRYDVNNGITYALFWEAKGQQPGAVKNINESLSVQAVPNPFSTATQIALSRLAGSISVSIYDVEGRLVNKIATANTDKIIIERDDLPQGLYNAKVNADGQVTTIKLAVQ
jgi:hypothetical protein